MNKSDSLAAVDGQHPWLGLVAYTEENRQYFHGRDDEARELVRRLERKTLTILFGQSGLGKSSLLQAGVFPRLRTAGYVPVYLRLDHGPEAPPLAEQIKPVVLAETTVMGTWSHAGGAVPGESLWEYFHHRGDVLRGGSGQQLIPVLVFDQFEELFTLGAADDAARARAAAFIADLADLVENRAPATFESRVDAGTVNAEAFDFARSDYRVLITLREDYLPHLESLKSAMPALMQNRMRLTRLSGAQALEAVVKPAPGLVPDDVAAAIVAFVSGRGDLAQAEVEPSLLSLVCRELNHRRLAAGSAQIDAALLAGSRETILTEFYERTLADQPPAVRHWVENELLTDSGYRENIALERARKSLSAAGADPAAIDTLVSRRLLRIEERLDVRRIELTHDVLCAVVRASRDARREREATQEAERRRLETEAALAEARSREAKARRSLWRARLMLGFCAVLALVAAYGFWEASRAKARAERLAAIADQSLATANAARAQADAARGQAEYLVSYLVRDLEPVLQQYGRLPQLKQLAEKAIAYFSGLPAGVRGPETARNEAKAWLILAEVQSAQGEREAWRKSAQTLIGQLEQIVAVAPNDAEYRIYLIWAKCWVYDYAIETGKFSAQDQAYFDAARAEVQTLAASQPANLEVLRIAAQFQSNYELYVTLDHASKHQRAFVDRADQARAVWGDIVRRDPATKVNRVWYARAIMRQGNSYAQAGEPVKAKQFGKEAVDYTEQALKEEPGNIALLEAAALAAQRLSYETHADYQLMRQAELIARERNRVLTEIDPTNQYYRYAYVQSHRMEGYALASDGRWREAGDIFHHYRTLLEALPADTKANMPPEYVAEAVVNEGRCAAAMGDVDGARSLLLLAREKTRALRPDKTADDPADRPNRIKWLLQNEAGLTNAMHDWPETERMVGEIQREIAAAMLADPTNIEIMLRQAEADSRLGLALLRQNRIGEARQRLAQAVAGFESTPPTIAAVSYTRADDTLRTREWWAEALTVTGEPTQARGILAAALSTREARLADGNDWGAQCDLARTCVLLAATFDLASATEAAQRTTLLDRAANLLISSGGDARHSMDSKNTLALIARLRRGE